MRSQSSTLASSHTSRPSGSPKIVTPPISCPVRSCGLRGSEAQLAHAELAAHRTVHVETGVRQRHTHHVLTHRLLRRHQDRVRRFLQRNAVGLAELGGVGEVRVAVHHLVLESEPAEVVDHIGVCAHDESPSRSAGCRPSTGSVAGAVTAPAVDPVASATRRAPTARRPSVSSCSDTHSSANATIPSSHQ